MRTRNKTHARTLAALAAAVTAGPALANDSAPQDEPSLREQATLDFSLAATSEVDDRYRLFEGVDFTFIPGVWMPRLRGHITLGPSPAAGPVNIETGLDLRDLEPTFVGELEITKHDVFTLIFTGFDFSTGGRGTFPFAGTFGPLTMTPGDAYTSSFDLTSFSAELAVGVFRPFSALKGRPIDLRVSPMFVARYLEADLSVTSDGSTAAAGGEWIAALAGLRAEVDLYPESEIFLISGLKLDAAAAFGPALGGEGGIVYQVRAGLTAAVTDNIGFTFGYRLIDLDVEDGPLSLDTPLAGLFLGGVIRF